jgi:hypothetical protein
MGPTLAFFCEIGNKVPMHVAERRVCDYHILKQCSQKILLLPFFEIGSLFQHANK